MPGTPPGAASVPVPAAAVVPPAFPHFPAALPLQPVPGGQRPAAMDPQAVADRKQKRETQNINITLYVASLLMVAAAALFVGSTLPATARLVGVWFGTAAFYAAGLLVHRKVPRLKPAAIAFTGTALAIIPFAGIATYNLGVPNGAAVWLFTSLIGTLAYVVAAVRLQSRLIVYTSLAFLLSTVWSSTAVLGAALAWYFAALIVLSALLQVAGQLLARRSRAGHRAAALYAKPLTDLGPWFAPAGLIASLVVGPLLNAADHLLVLAAGVIYFGALLALPGQGPRGWNYLGLRFSLTLAAPFLGWLLVPESTWVSGALTLGLALQVVAIAHVRLRVRALRGIATWTAWDVVASTPAVAVAGLLWTLDASVYGDANFAAWGLVVALLAAIAVVPTLLPKGEWLPLPALGAILVLSPLLTALGWTVLLGIMLAYTTTRFATEARARWKQAWLIGARFTATALAAAALAAFVPPQPEKGAAIAAAVAVLSGLQLLVDAWLTRTRKAGPWTVFSALAWTAVGTCLVVLLAEAASGSRTYSMWVDGSAAPRWEFLLAAVAMAVGACVYSVVSLQRGAGNPVGELAAPVYLVVATLAVGPVFHAGGAAAAWALTVGYLLALGIMLRGKGAGLHRWLYWWAARLASLLLSVALFQLWREFDPATTVAGTGVDLGAVLTLALLPQLPILAAAVAKGRQYPWLDADMAVTLGLTLLAAALWVPGAGPGGWTVVVLVPALSAAMAVLMWAVTCASHSLPAARWAAPSALLLLALQLMGEWAPLGLVLAITAVTASYLAVKAGTLLLRSLHALLARTAATAFVAALAGLLAAGPTTASLVLCLALAAQVAVQWLVWRSAALRARVGQAHVLQASLWGVLAAQLVLPAAYYGASGGFRAPGTGLRWVVVLELGVLAASAIFAQLHLKQRGAAYLSLAAVMGAAAVVAPTLWPGATALALLLLCVAVIAWRCLSTPKAPEMQWFWLVATAAMLLTAHVVDADAALGVFAGLWLVAGLALLVATQLMKLAWLTIPGAVLVFIAAILFRGQVLDMTGHAGYSALAGFLVVAGTLYVVRFIMVDLAGTVHIAGGALTASALVGGAVFALWSMLDDGTVLWGAAAFTVLAVAACLEAPARHRSAVVDAAILGCAAVWFWACSSYVDLGAFWSVQWCAMALGALSVKRYWMHRPAAGRKLLMAAAAFASLGALVTVLNGNTLEQIISLVVFVALLIVGMSLDERVFTVWGAVGVATAVVWYLRDFTYLLLAALALALIAFAIWRLNRKKPVPAPERQAGR